MQAGLIELAGLVALAKAVQALVPLWLAYVLVFLAYLTLVIGFAGASG